MPKIGIKPPRGFYANGTEHDQKGRWNSGSLVRWIDDVLRPIGGSRRWVNISQGTVPYRGLHAWLDLSRNKWLAYGAHNVFKAVKGSGVTFFDLTPPDLATGRQDAEYEDGYGFGLYGDGTYGAPIAQLQDGALDPATTWDIDNFGETLIACHSDDGRILEWNLDVTGGSNLLDAANADFSQLTGTDATSNGGLGGGGWTENPGINGSGWEIDTSAKTCTYTPFGGPTTLQYELRGLTVGQKYRIRATKTGSGSLRVTVRNGVTNAVATDINTSLSIITLAYGMQNDNSSPYFEATNSIMVIFFNGDSFGSNTTTIANVSFVSAPVLTAVTNAPVNNKGVLVTDERFVFALGSGGNPRKIAFSDREDRNTWTPAATNEAGDIELNDTGEIMCGVKTRGQTLILTTTSAHTMRYIGAPYVYSTNIAGSNCGVISKKAAVNTEAGVFWMGDKSFYYFDGNMVRDLNCEVLDFIFNDFDYGQKSKIFAWVNSKYNEVWWHYLNSSTIDDPVSYYEPNRYVSYNYKDNYWMIGDLLSARTSGIDAGIFDYPLTMWNLGQSANRLAYIQEQEVGTTFGDSAFAEAGALEIGKGDNIMKVSSIYPVASSNGAVSLKLYARNYTGDDWALKKSISVSQGKRDARLQGREIKYRVEGNADVDWRFSELRFDVTQGGKR